MVFIKKFAIYIDGSFILVYSRKQKGREVLPRVGLLPFFCPEIFSGLSFVYKSFFLLKYSKGRGREFPCRGPCCSEERLPAFLILRYSRMDIRAEEKAPRFSPSSLPLMVRYGFAVKKADPVFTGSALFLFQDKWFMGNAVCGRLSHQPFTFLRTRYRPRPAIPLNSTRSTSGRPLPISPVTGICT